MQSIHTNAVSLKTIALLRSYDMSEQQVTGRIASGLRIGAAADNPAYWSISQAMRSDSGTLNAAIDMNALTAAQTGVAYAGMTAALELVSRIRDRLVAAREPGTDRNKLNQEIVQLKAQLITTARAASFSGDNWLYNAKTAAIGVKNLVTSVERDDRGALIVSSASFDTATAVLLDSKQRNRGLLNGPVIVKQPSGSGTTNVNYYLINLNNVRGLSGTEISIDATTLDKNISGMIDAVTYMMGKMTDAAATLGAITTRASAQRLVTERYADIMKEGIGRLVDADMNEQSTRLKALQAQKQLAYQSLSIGNAQALAILQLFH